MRLLKSKKGDYRIIPCDYLNFARVGGFHMQGIKGEVVVYYFEPLITQQMEASGSPKG
jgi:hypothetical protein